MKFRILLITVLLGLTVLQTAIATPCKKPGPKPPKPPKPNPPQPPPPENQKDRDFNPVEENKFSMKGGGRPYVDHLC